MFKRKLQVDVVKVKDAPVKNETVGPSFGEKAEVVAKYIERSIKMIAVGVCAYVILDTARQVAVELAKPQEP